MVIGFNYKNESGKNIYDDCLGRAGHYGVGAVSATGVLKEINFEKGYLVVQPSIVGCGGYVKLEKERPTIISMAQGSPVSMRPLSDDALVKIVEEHQDKDKKFLL